MALALFATLVSTAFFVCMAWAVRGHFRGLAAVGMKAATAINAAAMAWFVWERWRVLSHRSALPPWRDATSMTMTILALALFWWAVATTRRTRLTLAFSADSPSFLVEEGPYALVRHPFYTSYVLFWIGASFSSATLMFWIVPVAITGLYFRAATLEEFKFRQSALATRYRDYQSRTGMMLPRLFGTEETTRW